jgi:DNA processing protein
MVVTPHALTDAERLDWLRLIRSENIGPRIFFHLLNHFDSAAAALEAAPELARRGGRKRPIRITPREKAEAELDALTDAGARLIAWGEPEYSRPLAAIADPPPVIQIIGHAHLMAERCVAVVGARNASAAGCRFARDICAQLGKAALVVVSGMARGIDTAAHESTLDTGTVAVFAGGIDVVYPEENTSLYEKIAARGLVVSEQPFGTRPIARHFPPRNRLISGLSLGVVVVEAAPKSGSLITARLALEQGREVFAVPGSPLDPRHRGTNELIRQGAVLCESAADVVESLPGVAAPLGEPESGDFGAATAHIPNDSELLAARRDVVEKLGPVPVTVDELLRECQLSPAILHMVLLELELAGRLDRSPGNKVALVL